MNEWTGIDPNNIDSSSSSSSRSSSSSCASLSSSKSKVKATPQKSLTSAPPPSNPHFSGNYGAAFSKASDSYLDLDLQNWTEVPEQEVEAETLNFVDLNPERFRQEKKTAKSLKPTLFDKTNCQQRSFLKSEQGQEISIQQNTINNNDDVRNSAKSNSKISEGEDQQSTVNESSFLDLGFLNLGSLRKLRRSDLRQLSQADYDKLSLSHNCLPTIPWGFFSKLPKLERLVMLDLSCNQLSYLPNDLDHLVNLTHLNLFLNKLRWLTPSLGKLTKLRWLNLSRNPDLLKWDYFRTIAGPMSNDAECFECAVNVLSWIQDLTERGTGVRELELRGQGQGRHQGQYTANGKEFSGSLLLLSSLRRSDHGNCYDEQQHQGDDEDKGCVFDAHLLRPPDQNNHQKNEQNGNVDRVSGGNTRIMLFWLKLKRLPRDQLQNCLTGAFFRLICFVLVTFLIMAVFVMLTNPAEFEALLKTRFSFMSKVQQEYCRAAHGKIQGVLYYLPTNGWTWTWNRLPNKPHEQGSHKTNPGFWTLFRWYFRF